MKLTQNNKLEELLRLTIFKMSILETELESTQTLLVNMFSSNRTNRERGISTIKENFEKLRDIFNNEANKIKETEEE